MQPDTSPEPYNLALQIPPELGDVEVICTFMGYSKGGAIDPTSAEAKLSIGIPRESKYEALKLTDRPGDTLYFVVLGRVRPDFAGMLDDDDDQ